MDKYVRLYRDGTHYITKVLAGYEPSHDRGHTWYNAKNKILTEWDVENGVNEPHNDYTTTLLRRCDKIVLKEDGQIYVVSDSAGTFFEYHTENVWYTLYIRILETFINWKRFAQEFKKLRIQNSQY